MRNSPSLKGMLSFLEESPEEARTRILRQDRIEKERAKVLIRRSTAVLPRVANPVVQKSQVEIPVTYIPVVDNTECYNPKASTTTVYNPQVSHPVVDTPQGGTNVYDTKRHSPTSWTSTRIRSKKIFRATLAQHGHTPAEQVLYQVMWNRGTPLSDGSKSITAGYRELAYFSGINDKSVKLNLKKLQSKLSIRVTAPEDRASNLGRTYQIFSYDQILHARTKAGLVWVRKSRGVELLREPPMVDNPMVDTPMVDIPMTHIPQVTNPQGVQPIGAIVSDTTPPVVSTTTHRVSNLVTSPRNTSSSQSIAEDLIQGIRQFFPDIDHEAIETLRTRCQAKASNCTSREILYFVESKMPVITKGRIRNPIGFILDVVPKCFEGKTFQDWREEQKRLAEEQRMWEERKAQEAEELEREIEEYERKKNGG